MKCPSLHFNGISSRGRISRGASPSRIIGDPLTSAENLRMSEVMNSQNRNGVYKDVRDVCVKMSHESAVLGELDRFPPPSPTTDTRGFSFQITRRKSRSPVCKFDGTREAGRRERVNELNSCCRVSSYSDSPRCGRGVWIV